MKTAELRQERAGLIENARKLVDVAEKDKRDLSGEEQESYDKHLVAAEELRSRFERDETLEKLELELAAPVNPVRPDDVEKRTPSRAGAETTQASASNPRATPEYEKTFNRYLLHGRNVLSDVECRALQADDDPGGGFLVTPEAMSSKMIQAVDDSVFIRRLATVETLTQAASLGVPSLDTDLGDADWTAEIGTVSEDTALAFGKRSLTPHPLSKLVKVSNKLIRISTRPIDGIIRERMAYKFGVTHEKAFLTGTGAQQALGVFTASSNGISTGRDVSTDNTTTAPTFDGLKNAKYKLKSAYWPRATWAFHPDAVKILAKLKDGEGRYIWQDGVRVGEPDRLLNFPIEMSEFAPNTFTTGLYVGILGDFSFYWIVDALPFTIQVLTELYAANNQIGYIGRMESDGMPVLEEAFVRVTLGS